MLTEPTPGETRMKQGRIIFLNGTSSSGKTTLAHQLQEILPQAWLHIALDQFRDGLPPRYRGLNAPKGSDGFLGLNVVPTQKGNNWYTEICFGEVGKTMLKGMRRAIAVMAESGNNIIIDDVLLEPEFLEDYLTVFEHLRIYFVGVRCPKPELDKREGTRPGRFPGTATGHFEICHQHGIYDIEVDTSAYTPLECASKVASHIASHKPSAFRALTENKKANSI